MRKGFNGYSVQTRNPSPKPPNTDARQPRPPSPPKPTLLNIKKEKIKITFD